MARRPVVLMIILIVALSGCGRSADEGAQVGQRLPDVAFTTFAGETVRPSDFAGRPVVINFWATWCGPCKAEIPVLAQVYNEYLPSHNLQILGVTDERASVVRDFLAVQPIAYPVLFDRGGRAGTRYRVQSIPTTLFIAADGTVFARHLGAINEAQLRGYLDALLATSPAPAPPDQAAPPAPPAPLPSPVPAPTSAPDNAG